MATQTDRCFPRRHMPPAVDSFYWYVHRRYEKAGVFNRDDRYDAEQYGASKAAITRYVQCLEREGWIIPRRTGNDRHTRNKDTGRIVSIPYDVLEHSQWAEKHPGRCYNGKRPDGYKKPRIASEKQLEKWREKWQVKAQKATNPVPTLETGACPHSKDRNQSLESQKACPHSKDIIRSKDLVVKTCSPNPVGESGQTNQKQILERLGGIWKNAGKSKLHPAKIANVVSATGEYTLDEIGLAFESWIRGRDRDPLELDFPLGFFASECSPYLERVRETAEDQKLIAATLERIERENVEYRAKQAADRKAQREQADDANVRAETEAQDTARLAELNLLIGKSEPIGA